MWLGLFCVTINSISLYPELITNTVFLPTGSVQDCLGDQPEADPDNGCRPWTVHRPESVAQHPHRGAKLRQAYVHAFHCLETGEFTLFGSNSNSVTFGYFYSFSMLFKTVSCCGKNRWHLLNDAKYCKVNK